MRRLLFIIIAVLLFLLLAKLAYSAEIPKILQRAYEAQSLLAKTKPHLIKRGKVTIGRSVPIAIYDEASDKIQIIQVDLTLERNIFRDGKLEKDVHTYEVRPPSFDVYKIGGNGINTDFYITDGTKSFVFLGWRYIRENGGETRVYSPYTELPHKDEVAAFGKQYLIDVIRKARAELLSQKVFSHAFPSEYVADVVPERLVYDLALIEHMDVDEYRDAGPIFMANKVLVQLALNRNQTFSYARSSAGALCLMQIMRGTYGGYTDKPTHAKIKKGKTKRAAKKRTLSKVKGKTHKGILQMYPEARLPANPVNGSCDSHVQAIKVAYLVLDDKLSSTTQEFRYNFRRDPPRLSCVLGAGYNGGPKRTNDLYAQIRESKISELLEKIGLLRSSSEYRLSRILKNETWNYVRECLEVDRLY